MIVLGVDPSLTHSGLAILRRGEKVVVGTISSTGHRADTLAQRHGRQIRIMREFSTWLPKAQGVNLAVIEGPSFGSRGGSAWDRSGLWWAMVRVLMNANIPVAVCPPMVRAKWATDNGLADKAAVASAVTRITGIGFDSSDEADAAALAWIGALRFGWVQGPREGLLAKVEWPDVQGDLLT